MRVYVLDTRFVMTSQKEHAALRVIYIPAKQSRVRLSLLSFLLVWNFLFKLVHWLFCFLFFILFAVFNITFIFFFIFVCVFKLKCTARIKNIYLIPRKITKHGFSIMKMNVYVRTYVRKCFRK